MLTLHLCNLGNSFNQIGHHVEAIESFNQAIACEPDYVEAYTNIGIAFVELKEPDKAITSLNKALELDPDFSEAHECLGYAYIALGKFSDAADHLVKVSLKRSSFLLIVCIF